MKDEKGTKMARGGFMKGDKKKCPTSHKKGLQGEEGKIQGYAMGGVAKIRHKQSTPKGLPIMKKIKAS